MPTQHGSSLYLNHRSNVDSSPVSILRSAGALIFGKTTTPEFTVLNSGPSTANPHDKARTPGGSSTGSAAAVADFQVPLSIGTQNGGSIVRPASYSGIFAMKPTHNLISAEGVKMVSFNLDTCGFFARCIEDIQLVAQIFNVRSAILPGKKPIDQLKVAFVKSPFWDMAGPGTVSAMDTAARVLCAHGVSVEEPELPWELGDATLLEQTHNMVLRAEARSAFLMEYRMEGAREKLDQYVIDMVENKDEYTLDDTILAVKRYADMRTAFDKFASQYDAIITPSAVDIAPLGLDDMGPYIFNFLWTPEEAANRSVRRRLETPDEHEEYMRPRIATLRGLQAMENWVVRGSTELTYADFQAGIAERKTKSFAKIRFASDQAAKDGLDHVWVDTCCIDRMNGPEHAEAIVSMFRWYREATRCYAYLTDVDVLTDVAGSTLFPQSWEAALHRSRWFTRGWTLQEMLAPTSVDFFSCNGVYLGSRASPELQRHIQHITNIPSSALQGGSLADYTIETRLSWVEGRETQREEDKWYSMMGIADVVIPIIYGEGSLHAYQRLREAINAQHAKFFNSDSLLDTLPTTASAAFNSAENQYNATCLANTRATLLDEIKQWADGADDRFVYWLNGSAGTGKSTIARTLAQHYEEQRRLGGSYFFSAGGGAASGAAKLLTTLASQLARNIPASAIHIHNAIVDHKDIAKLGLREQWEKLIINPLTKVGQSTTYATIVFIWDALDECSDVREIREVLQLLARTTALKATRLRVLVTSRPEPHIRRCFNLIGNADRHECALHEMEQAVVEEDIATFFKDAFATLRRELSFDHTWPGEKALAAFVYQAQGLFIWASTAYRYISEGDEFIDERIGQILVGRGQNHQGYRRRSSLGGPEQRLDEIYTTVLQQATRRSLSEDERITLHARLRHILGTLATMQSPLPLGALADLLGLSPRDVEVSLSQLHAIVNIPRDRARPIKLHHPSFRDYLLHEGRCTDVNFRIHPAEAHSAMASCCIQRLTIMLKSDMCKLGSPGTLREDVEPSRLQALMPLDVQYACAYWVEHLRQGTSNEQNNAIAFQFYSKFFLQWFEALSLLGRASEFHSNVSQIRFIKDSRRFIGAFDAIIERVPLQIYSAALVYARPTNMLRRHFWHHLTDLIKRVCVVRADAPDPKDTYNYVNNLAFTPDGSQLSSGSNDERVRVWGVPTMSVLAECLGHVDKVSSTAISPDGTLLASGADDYEVRLWHMENKQVYRVLLGHSKWVNCVIFAHSGIRLASGSMDGTIRLWDIAPNTEPEVIELEEGGINSLAFSPDDSLLAAGTVDQTIPLWDMKQRKIRMHLQGHTRAVNSVTFSFDGTRLASGSNDETIRVWSVLDGESIMRLTGHSSKVWAVAFSRDGRQIASGSEDRTIRLWDAANGNLLHRLLGHQSGINAVVYAPSGNLLASCSFDDDVVLWNSEKAECHERLPDFGELGLMTTAAPRVAEAVETSPAVSDARAHASVVTCVAISPDGNLVASGSTDTTVKIWSIDGVQSYNLAGHTASIHLVVFSPLCDTLATASTDGKLCLWDPRSGTLRYRLPGHEQLIHAVCFSSDGVLLASCSEDMTARLWDCRSGKNIHTFGDHTARINGVALSPNGTRLVTCSDDKTTRMWNVDTTEPATASTEVENVIYDNAVKAIAFSADGKNLCAAFLDGSVVVSDVDGKHHKTLEGHTRPVTSVAFSNDGKVLATASEDEMIVIWDLELNEKQTRMQLGTVVRRLAFSETDENVETDRGWIGVGASPVNPSTMSRGLFVTKDWVSIKGNNVLHLADDQAATCVATWRDAAVLGHASGALTFIGF
nr:hypothetical protein B0A51_12754 [Rachicladosporium sp. CCFEE 5018]